MTRNEQKRLDHALHNEKVCNLLYEDKSCPDWVITTAFYSCIHFVRYKLFPFEDTDSGNRFMEFDYYCAYYEDRNLSQHQQLIVLAKRNLPHKLRDGFGQLFGLCKNARYNDYLVEDFEKDFAYDYMQELKKYCNTGKQKSPSIRRGKRPRINKTKPK